MKYTAEQKEKLNRKQLIRFEKYKKKELPNVTIKKGFFIVESKLNLNYE